VLAEGSNAMESLHLSQPGEAISAAEFEFGYIEPAPHDEVMMEQLEYLLLHSRSGRHARCNDCARLEKISAHLLAPFC
jgi:hypothetical protein